MKTKLLKLTCGLALLGAALSASAQSIVTIGDSDRGYYGQGGYSPSYFASGSTASYLVEWTISSQNTGLHDFFVFDLSGVASGTITSAQLVLADPYANNGGNVGSGTYQLWDVSTSMTALENGTTISATFADLGSGTAYGSQTFSSADTSGYVTVNLNSDFLAAAQSALGSGQIAIGGSVDSSASYCNMFNRASSAAVTELVLDISPVPEPTTLALAGLGGLGLLLFRRRNK